MTDIANRFAPRVLLRQALVGAATYVAIAVFAPKLIVLEWDVAIGVFTIGATLSAMALATVAILSFWRLRAHRFVVRALALGSRAVEPEDLSRLAGLPNNLTSTYVFVTTIYSALILVPGLRPDKLDDGRAISLVILSITILVASSIPHYVLARNATSELFELSPLEPLGVLLESEENRNLSARRIQRRLLVAVAVPVALVGAGAVLVAHAHLRTLTEQTKRQTALVIARTALEPTPGSGSSEISRNEAIAAAAKFGFAAKVERTTEQAPLAVSREASGEITVSAPIEDGRADVSFASDLDPAVATGGAAVGVLAVLVAAALGTVFGRAVGRDLVFATRSIRQLGTESIIRGTTRFARPSRFAVVANLGRAIEVLTERFRIFAAAQERALQAREAAQRMRGLLFASVSHDLKSPLNAILGFAELVSREPLTDAQRESLELITKRGRELLALIETILDAARVEAGQLTLIQRPTDVSAIVSEAIAKAHELAIDIDVPVDVAAQDLPDVPVDRAYATRAVAVIIAHAFRVSHGDPGAGVVRINGASDGGERVRIDIEYGSGDCTKEELELLFARQVTSRGKGLTLGLSLARSVIELHGGSVEVEGAADGAPICRVYFPIYIPDKRPTLSSIPSLG